VTYLAISVGAVLGANARYLVGGWVTDRFGTSFPIGTLLVNVTGSFAIGLFLTLIGERLVVADWWRPQHLHHARREADRSVTTQPGEGSR
jgi:fluoride ion exporter CrcB/FEX